MEFHSTDEKPESDPRSVARGRTPTAGGAPFRRQGLPPVIDAGVIDQLRSELGDDEAVFGFLRALARGLVTRVECLEEAIAEGSHALALDRVLSLRVGAEMAGLDRLATEARDLQAICELEIPPAFERIRALHAEVDRAAKAVEHYLGDFARAS